MKSKKSIWSLLLLVVAMLAAVQFSCKKDEGDDEETSTKTETETETDSEPWDCVIDITNNRNQILILMCGEEKTAIFVRRGQYLHDTIRVSGSPVTLYLKNANEETFCSKTLKKGERYSVVADVYNTNVDVQWHANFSVTNKTEVDLELVLVGNYGENVLTTISAGEEFTERRGIAESSVTAYLRRSGDEEKFDVVELSDGNNEYKRTIELLRFKYQITNERSETVHGYMQSQTGDPQLFIAVKSGKTESGTAIYSFYGDAEYDVFTFYMTDTQDNLLTEKKSVKSNEEYVVTVENDKGVLKFINKTGYTVNIYINDEFMSYAEKGETIEIQIPVGDFTIKAVEDGGTQTYTGSGTLSKDEVKAYNIGGN